MNRIIKFAMILAASSLLVGCVKVSHGNLDIQQHDDNAVEHYVLRQVMEYDPLNATGIDILQQIPEFSTVALTIYYEDGKVAYAEFDHGSMPYNPLSCALPEGKVGCSYDDGVYPPVLRLENGGILATMIYYEPVFDFTLDYNKIHYRYTFKAVK